MKPERARNRQYTGATLLLMLLLLLTGADSGAIVPQCDNGPGGAIRILTGTGASLAQDFSDGDNNTYALTIDTPDPYLAWKNASETGSHSLTCFMDYWNKNYAGDERPAVVWFSEKQLCATISSIKYTPSSTGGTITAVLKRPSRYYPALSGSDRVAIEIDRSCNPDTTICFGKIDLYSNCFTPFFSPETSQFTASAPRATLNFATFDSAWMPNSNLGGAILSNASFTNANLRGVNLDDAVMVFTDFNGADLNDAHAYGSFVYKATNPRGEEVNSYQALLGGTATTTTTTAKFSNNHVSFVYLSAQNTTDNVSTTFVNSIFNDLTEFHTFFFLTVGAGTVELTIQPDPPADVFYGIVGFLGLTPITIASASGLPIDKTIVVPFFSFGIIFLTTTPVPPAYVIYGATYPVVMEMKATLTSP